MDTNEYVKQEIERSGSTCFASKVTEEALIGRMLQDMQVAQDVSMELTADDFYFGDYARIFRGIQSVLAKKAKVDLITVDSAVTELYPLQGATLSQAMVECYHAAMKYRARAVDDYVKIIRELSTRRRSIANYEQLLVKLKDPSQNVGELLEQARADSARVTDGRHQWTTMQDVLLSTYMYLEKRQRGEIKSITSGIKSVDALIGGFFGGELTVIGARPSVGKSAFGANIALAAASEGYKVAVVSREMTDIQFGARLISHESWVNGMKLRKGEIESDDWEKLAESLNRLADLPIDFMFAIRTIEELVSEITRKVERKECDILIVDYLQLVETQRRFEKDYQRVGYISAELKHLATDCNIPVVALAQVNRETDGQMPSLRSLRDSGNIEQDADGVIFLHRPKNANDDSVDARDKDALKTWTDQGYSYLCVGIAKQRQGMTGRTCLLFDPALMRYVEIDRRG